MSIKCKTVLMKLAFILCVLASLPAWISTGWLLRAQGVESSIEGTVTDSSGAAIAGAEIVLTNTQTGVVRSTRSDSSGRYSFPTVQPGEYSLSVTKQGFAVFNLTQ